MNIDINPKVEFPELYPDTKMTGKSDQGRPLFVLEKPFQVFIDTVPFTIPAGFEYDYASVPRAFWSIFPPNEPDYAAASTLHDWVYSGEIFPREFNDHLFLSAMEFTNVKPWKRKLMYQAVHHFGGLTYEKHSLESVMKVRRLSKWDHVYKRPLYDIVF